ncbi:MAG TPA: type I glyceraldehyde-3-phosphate dehydrogenase [Actinomycetota bacterium]|nr:type I glyceraldehyde-3-phosphate dehydrogenase [Actinomycetota bacterium]
MTIRVGINGFGRIGRHVARILASGTPGLELGAINTTRRDPRTLAHLLRYDSVHGRFEGAVVAEEDRLLVGARPVRVTAHPDPAQADWGGAGVDVVLEATGAFNDGEAARGHLRAGARWVLITAPAPRVDATIVVGANEETLDPERHRVVSGASCTTMCLAPVARILDEVLGIEGGFVTTVHAYTRDQELVDGSHDDLRRARAAALNIVPTRTGAARTLGEVLPGLAGKLGAMAVRVPVADVSLLAVAASVERRADAATVNAAYREAAARPELQGIVGVTDEPLVSSDLIGDPRSAVVDLGATRTGPANVVQVMAWYDNEVAYAHRMVDIIRLLTGTVRPAASLTTAHPG